MRDGRGGLFVTRGCLARLATLRWRKGLACRGWLVVVLVSAVGRCARGEFGYAALLSSRGRSRQTARLTRAAFPACTAPAMSSAATSPAATPLAALSAVGAITRRLTLLCARLDAKAWLPA